MESEKNTEKYLIQQVENLGGFCRKYTSPGVKGVPDQICFFYNIIKFVEVKSEGEQPTGPQVREMGRLSLLGHDVRVVDTKQQVNQLIEETKHELLTMF